MRRDRLGLDRRAVTDREFGHRPHGVVDPLGDPHVRRRYPPAGTNARTRTGSGVVGNVDTVDVLPRSPDPVQVSWFGAGQ